MRIVLAGPVLARTIFTSLLLSSASLALAAQEAVAPVADAKQQGNVQAAVAVPSVPSPDATYAPYVPQDDDERGLWRQVDEFERQFKNSNFVIRDEKLNAYVKEVLCKTVGPECHNIRLYLVRNPYFNASMAPNGMMQVWSGLLLRVQDEAQLATVLGHEFGHYKKLHSLQNFRNIRSKTNTMGWLSVLPLGGLASLGLQLAQFGLIGSIFSFNRGMEAEADLESIGYLNANGYDPAAAAEIWSQLRDEADATALARGKKSRKDKNGGIYATHPPTKERMTYLRDTAVQLKAKPGAGSDRGKERYRAAVAPFWADFVNDQINLNDFGGTELLLGQLAAGDGWSSGLLFARGELYRLRGRPEDLTLAAGFYRQAVADPAVTPDAWRGLGLALLRTGDKAGGQAAVSKYLELKPGATDATMMRSLAGPSAQ